jgi:hypothetical protein
VAVPLWAHPRCRGRRCWRGQVHAAARRRWGR